MGSLTIVGTGICAVAQATIQARGHIRHADKVLHLVTDSVTEGWLRELNPSVESLVDCYREGEARVYAYERMTERILSWVRKDLDVCVALYGHPGVFVRPSHDAIRKAREEGYSAVMLPGVSAEDCLYADLGFDPAGGGCQSYETTDFLTRRPRFEPSSHLVLWQVSVIGDMTYSARGEYRRDGLEVLVDVLARDYPADHEVVLYLAALYSVCEPVIQRLPLSALPTAEVSPTATLYVPPYGRRAVDHATVERLGLAGAGAWPAPKGL
jgi:uncharacterized protein YabN with tetrapyrrole methylase and pyrophosphatase domain